MEAALGGVVFFVAIFVCVLLHEFGHALAARCFGVGTRDITLLPIGGVARLERMPDKPAQEFWIAVAGPAVNVVIAVILAAWLTFTGSWTAPSSISTTAGPFAERLLAVNLFHDGARVPRARARRDAGVGAGRTALAGIPDRCCRSSPTGCSWVC